MTKSLAFSPAIPGKLGLLLAISGKLVLLPAIPGKLVLLPAIPGKLSLLPAISYNKKLHPASVFSDRLLQCSFFSVFIPSGFCIQVDFISGSHTQANHNFRLSHPGQSRFQALTPKPITISGSHIGPAIYPTYCSFRSPLR